MNIHYIDTTVVTDDFTSRTVAKVEQEKSTLLDISIGQRVRISDNAFPGTDEPADIAARGKEATVFASVSDDGCWLVETDEYDLIPVTVDEIEPLTTEED
jgi:hypothetical protein